MKWVRLWQDMPTDPKWRTIARKSGQRIGDVMAVFNFMMVLAGEQAGSIEGWVDEDVATALDLDEADVAAIREAMQGRVLDGDALTGWEKRQPKREDDSAERVRKYREKSKAKGDVTQCNADVTQRNAPDTDTDTEDNPPVVPPDRGTKPNPRGERLPDDWRPPDDAIAWARQNHPTTDLKSETEKFRDYWRAQPGAKGRKLDWPATWRNWIRSAAERRPQPRASPGQTGDFLDYVIQREQGR